MDGRKGDEELLWIENVIKMLPLMGFGIGFYLGELFMRGFGNIVANLYGPPLTDNQAVAIYHLLLYMQNIKIFTGVLFAVVGACLTLGYYLFKLKMQVDANLPTDQLKGRV